MERCFVRNKLFTFEENKVEDIRTGKSVENLDDKLQDAPEDEIKELEFQMEHRELVTLFSIGSEQNFKNIT